MRDLQADKEMCGNATPGPWEVMKPIIGRRAWCVVEQKEQDAGYHNLICRRDNTKNRKLDCNNVKFIAAAREGWPHAIERAIKAEAEVERLKLMVKSITGGLDEAVETVNFLEAENAKLRAVVDAAREWINCPCEDMRECLECMAFKYRNALAELDGEVER